MVGKAIYRDNPINEETEGSTDDDNEEDNEEEDEEREISEDRIMYPSPRISIEENEVPIIVRSAASFEERILEASPDASVPMELSPCDICGRKFNPTALERHIKVCQKVKSKPKKIFDAVNKLWKSDAEVEQEKQIKATKMSKTAPKKKKSNAKPEDNYQTCGYCQRRFCDNAFDRHVEFCKEKAKCLRNSPTHDLIAKAKLAARTKYNPKEKATARRSSSPSRKASMTSLYSEVSLPPWNLPSSLSGRNTPNYSSLTQREGNLRSSKRNVRPGVGVSAGTKSLGRAGGLSFLRTGDAGREDNEEDWAPESTPQATTLSRDASGRGSIRKPALTKAALLRLSAGEKKADEEEKKRIKNEFGNNNINGHSMNNFEHMRQKSVTPSLMTRSAYDYSGSSLARMDRSKSRTPQMSRRSQSRNGVTNYTSQESSSPYGWQSFKPLSRPSVGYSGGGYNPLTSQQRAEPDGIESEDLKDQRKDSLDGEYDHSKEYDPYQTAERQMQELLFGTGDGSTTSNSRSRDCPTSTYSIPPSTTMQKPKPVRPSATSAFSAYVPGGRQQATGSPSKHYGGNSTNYSGLLNNKSSNRQDYLASPTKFSSRDYGGGQNRDYTRSPVKARGQEQREGKGYGDVMTSSDYRGKDGTGALLARANSLRANMSKNWKDIFPSLTRQTPGGEVAEEELNLKNNKSAEIERAAASITSEAVALTQDLNRQNQAMARFCHGCGNHFKMANIRFCCECGEKRLYC